MTSPYVASRETGLQAWHEPLCVSTEIGNQEQRFGFHQSLMKLWRQESGGLSTPSRPPPDVGVGVNLRGW